MDTKSLETKIEKVIDIAVEIMSDDDPHHKVWELDQIIQTLSWQPIW